MRDFEFSAGWQRQLSSRRGSLGVGPFTPVAQPRHMVQSALGQDLEDLRPALGRSQAPELGEAGLAWLDDRADATPLGAAVVATALLDRHGVDVRKVPFADLWIAERGLAFAAHAVVELMALAGDGRDAAKIYPMRPGQDRNHWWQGFHLAYLFRVRAALAAAEPEEYAGVVSELAKHRHRHEYHRLATTLLAPGEPDWVEECVAATVATQNDVYRAVALTQAVTEVEQLNRLDAVYQPRWGFRWRVTDTHTQVATLLDGVGAELLDTLLDWYEDTHIDSDRERRLLLAVAQIPSDEAMRALIERFGKRYVPQALQEALTRYPERGVRLLAEAGPELGQLLRAHLLGHRDLAAALMPDLPAQAAQRAQGLLDDAATTVEAAADALPSLLVSPPWLNRVKTARPKVITGLVCLAQPAVHWRDGEQEAFAEVPRGYLTYRSDPATLGSWEERAARINEHGGYWYDNLSFLLEAPEDLARRVLPGYAPDNWVGWNELAPIVARFGADAIAPMILRVEARPADTYRVLAPLFSPELAVKTAEWLAQRKSARGVATTWLLRHSADASLALVPQALGKAGVARRQAEAALVLLNTRGEGAAVREAAQSYGAPAAAAIDELLARDPLMVLPAKVPDQPVWALPGLLPSVRVKDGSSVLPDTAVTYLITMFALSRMDQPYAGLDMVKETVNTDDLAAFAWALFEGWLGAGAEPKENWTLDAVALAGDDEAVRRLTPMILAWPGEGGHQRAVAGLGVLATIGTDVALMHLHTIAQRAKFKGLKTRAQEKMSEVADDLGLTADQLADRLVPGLGLADDGSLRLDYGPRQFVVGFDEQLKPFVADAAGKRLKTLPKPGAKDDPELAPAAYKQFSALKKDVRRVATDVIARLEFAMVNQRRWSGAEFRQLFVAHPLLRHIVRRLVWGLYDEQGRLTGSLRVAEDSSFADVSDEEVVLADDAVLGVVHPRHLDDVSAWTEVFADYEILQPFAQLSRSVFTLSPGSAESGHLEQFEGLKVPAGKLLGLERRGWQRESPMDAGVQGSIEVTFASGTSCTVVLDPGFIIGIPTEFEDQQLHSVLLRSNGDVKGPDPVAVSEILRDLGEVTGVTA
ncbi:DUF4132 domain-containing protein [Kineosporia babensis]|uniref:DUF4132 domain-containing protein n=1 Tax=Kineosporia babensis TaxID=499548 RepID=A0A9X1T2A2_9ACTN|nr:DUF4132 domain-containing protein [Kineosporia babensis]MCD5314428.1 DUF4132 domain-containing protein [Kineosporia babensis]